MNLNVFGALSGAFSGKSSKQTEEDGSSVESQEKSAHVKGAGAGNMRAAGTANAGARKSETKQQAITDDAK